MLFFFWFFSDCQCNRWCRKKCSFLPDWFLSNTFRFFQLRHNDEYKKKKAYLFLGKKVLFYKICLLGTDGNIEQFRIVVYIVHISQGTRMVQDFSTLSHNKWLYIAIFHKFNFLYPYSSGPRGHGYESRYSDHSEYS